MGLTMLTLDRLLPDPHFRERHGRTIDAPPAAVWRAVEELRLGDLALSRALMSIRMLPARLAGRSEASRMVSARLLEGGPVPVLATYPQRAVVAGGVLQPWKITGGDEPPELDAAALQAFAEPGWVKVGFDFLLVPDGNGSTRVTTETRVTATDPSTRARFRIYWTIIRAGSGLIRRDMLRAVARRAES